MKHIHSSFAVHFITGLLVTIASILPLGASAATCPLKTEKPYRTPSDNTVYLVTAECTKRPFFNPAVYLSHFASWNDVIFVEQPSLNAIPKDPLNFVPWGPLRKFKNGSLVKLTSNPSVYLLEDGKAYTLADEQAFKSFGYAFDQIEDVTQKTLDQFTIQSNPLKTAKDAPASLVFKYANSPNVFALKQTTAGLVKSHLKSMDEVNAISRGDRIATLTSDAVFADAEGTSNTADSVSPEIIAFKIGTSASSTSLTVPITQFTASDNIGVTGYLLTEASSTPSFSNPNWKTSVPSDYTFTTTGTRMLYAWTKDAIGNISASKSASIAIVNPGTDLTPPTISSIIATPTAAGMIITWKTNEAANSTVAYGSTTAYGATSVSSTLVTAHTINITGLNPGTTYHFTVSSVDASGNVQTSGDYTASLKADTTPPLVTVFTIPTSSTSMVVPVTLTATDDVGVAGYLLTKTTTVPLSNATEWSAAPPTTYDFARGGTVSVYAWAKDTSGNISASRIASSVITPGVTYPTISNLNVIPSATSLTMTWTTSLPTKTVLSYGLTAGYGSQITDNSFVSAHSAVINGLTSGQTYHYSITATTAANAAFSTENAIVTLP